MVVNEGESMRVLWTVSDYIVANDLQSEDEAAQDRLFKPLDITDMAIIFDGQACEGVSFTEQTVKAESFLEENWNVTLEALGIEVTGDFQVVKTNCPMFGFEEYVRLSDGTLIVPFEDVFYFFEPMHD